MLAPKEVMETELHRYFDELKPLLVEKTRLLEQEPLSVEEKVTIHFDFIKKAVLLFLPVLKSFLLNPFKSVLKTGTKELKIFGSVGMIAFVLIVFFVIGWLTLTVLVGAWFFDRGYSLTESVLYSLIFQIFSFLFVSSMGFLFLSKSATVSLIGFFKKKKKSVENQFEKSKQNE